ncbi:MAG: hypothetical protein VXZ16_01555 [Bacteroidota bacterium]|nr:hypothetical protein [Bacteroidota bacterium]
MIKIFTENLWVTAAVAIVMALLLRKGLSALQIELKRGSQRKTLANLDREQKLAVIRIWLEIIEADSSTSREEIHVIPNITPAEFNASRELSFDKAINLAKLMSGDARTMLLELSEEISQSDGIVTQSEEKVLDVIKSSIARC